MTPSDPTTSFLIHGTQGSSKTTTLSGLLRDAMNGLAGSAYAGHFGPGVAIPPGANGGFELEYISPPLSKAMGLLSGRKFPPKTLPDAIGAKGEFTRFKWLSRRWKGSANPGERLWGADGEVNVPALVEEFLKYDVVVLMFQAPLLNTPLGMKFTMGMISVYQLPLLGHGLTGAAEYAIQLCLGLSPEGLRVKYPLQYATIVAHEGSTVRWNRSRGKFVVDAVRNGTKVSNKLLIQHIADIVDGEVKENLGNLLVRHTLPYINDRAITALSYMDIANQFLTKSKIVTTDDIRDATDWLWGNTNRVDGQAIQVPNVVLELQPVGTTVPKLDAKGKPETDAHLNELRVPVGSVMKALDPTGPCRLWASIHHVVGRGGITKPDLKYTAPPAPPAPPAQTAPTWWKLRGRRATAVPTANGK